MSWPDTAIPADESSTVTGNDGSSIERVEIMMDRGTTTRAAARVLLALLIVAALIAMHQGQALAGFKIGGG
jgi:hypothetical protein